MLVEIDFEPSFLAPEGRHLATCVEVREEEKKTPKGTQKGLRLVFDWDLVEAGVQYKAGRTFMDKKVLQETLKEWLGKSIRGKSVDSQTLVGKRALLEIVHIPPNDDAYRFVNRILPGEEELKQAA
jgi:hypothetical protein